jgi:hypothetical protein
MTDTWMQIKQSDQEAESRHIRLCHTSTKYYETHGTTQKLGLTGILNYLKNKWHNIKLLIIIMFTSSGKLWKRSQHKEECGWCQCNEKNLYWYGAQEKNSYKKAS